MADGATSAEPEVSGELQALRALLIKDMKDMIENALGPVKQTLDLLQTTKVDHEKRIQELEKGLNLYSDKMAALEVTCEKLVAENKALLERAVDAEDRNRRFNLRCTNIDEKYPQGAENATKFMSTFFSEVLKDVFPSPPVLDIAHRIGKPRTDGKPRVMIVRFHYLQDKIRALAGNPKQLEWRGAKVRFFTDYSPATSKQRAAFANVKSLLYQKKVTFRLIYPAVLRVEHEEETHNFKTPAEAQQFYNQHFPG